MFEYEKFNFQPSLYEGIIQLTPSERDQIEKMIPKIIDVIEGEKIKFVGISDRNPLSRSIDDISKIKKYHPDAYNEFLKDLYKTIDQCKNIINRDKKINLNSRISSRKVSQNYYLNEKN